MNRRFLILCFVYYGRAGQRGVLTAVPNRSGRPEDSSEQQLAADADVVVLRIAIAFFTACLRIETEVVSHLPVTIDAVIEARAIDVAGSNARLGAVDTRIGNRLIAAEEFMLDAAQQGDLEVTAIRSSIVP